MGEEPFGQEISYTHSTMDATLEAIATAHPRGLIFLFRSVPASLARPC
jgi:hypothetical protein